MEVHKILAFISARVNRQSLLALLLAIGVTALIVTLQRPLRALGEYGYVGVFLVALLGHATVLIPVPGLAVTFAMGEVLNSWAVGLIAGAGEGLGELTGYLAGYGGQEIVQDLAFCVRTRQWVERYGAGIVFLLALVPNPLFDLVGMAAGALGISWPRFFLACWAGKTIRSLVFALMGNALFGPLEGVWMTDWRQPGAGEDEISWGGTEACHWAQPGGAMSNRTGLTQEEAH